MYCKVLVVQIFGGMWSCFWKIQEILLGYVCVFAEKKTIYIEPLRVQKKYS